MVADLRDIIDNSEAVSLDVTWNPTAGMYQARVWHEAERHARGDARNVFMQPPTEWLGKVGACLLESVRVHVVCCWAGMAWGGVG